MGSVVCGAVRFALLAGLPAWGVVVLVVLVVWPRRCAVAVAVAGVASVVFCVGPGRGAPPGQLVWPV